MMNQWIDHSKSSLEAAAEAAAKVNAMLIAKGKLKPSQLSTPAQGTKNKPSGTPNSLIVAEVEINDVPIGCRNMLTRGSTQEEISKLSGASVSTRGRFMTPMERSRNAGERALYLCVQGPNQDCVNLAVGRINEIIANGMKNPGKTSRFSPLERPLLPQVQPVQRPRMPLLATPQPLMSVGNQPTGLAFVQEKLYIGLEHAPPNFDVKGKILGPGGAFLNHIQNETGAKVTLRGKGSGFLEPHSGREAFEPMHIHIQHPTVMGLQQGKQLSENLIQTVQQEYAQFQQALAAMPPPINPGTATLLANLQQQSAQSVLSGGTVLGPPPPQQLAAVQNPGLQSVTSLQAPLLAPQVSTVLVSAPPPSLPSNLSAQSVLPAPGVVIPTTLGTSVAPALLSSIPGITSTQLLSPGLGSQLDAAGGLLPPNLSVPPPVLQTISTPHQQVGGPSSEQLIGGGPIQVSQSGQVLLNASPGLTVVQGGQLVTLHSGQQFSTGQAPPQFTLAPQTHTLPPPGVVQPVSAPVQLVSAIAQPVSAPPGGPVWGSPAASAPQMSYSASSPSMAPTSAITSTVTSAPTSLSYIYNLPLKEETKRRFTEEKQEDKLPENLLGYERQLGSSSDEWDEGDDFWNDSDSNYQQPSTRRGRKKKSQSQKKARKNSSSRGRTQERGGKNSSSSRGNSRGCGRGRGGGNTGGRRKRGPAKPVSEETKQAVERRKEELEHGPPHLTNLVVQGPPASSQSQQQVPQTTLVAAGAQLELVGTGVGPGVPLDNPQALIANTQIIEEQRNPDGSLVPSQVSALSSISGNQSYRPPVSGEGEGQGEDKQLMPPPPPPGYTWKRPSPPGGGPERKKMKEGSLRNLTGYGSDEEEEEVPSSLGSQIREVKKYSFNQYSSNPQLYGSNVSPQEGHQQNGGEQLVPQQQMGIPASQLGQPPPIDQYGQVPPQRNYSPVQGQSNNQQFPPPSDSPLPQDQGPPPPLGSIPHQLPPPSQQLPPQQPPPQSVSPHQLQPLPQQQQQPQIQLYTQPPPPSQSPQNIHQNYGQIPMSYAQPQSSYPQPIDTNAAPMYTQFANQPGPLPPGQGPPPPGQMTFITHPQPGMQPQNIVQVQQPSFQQPPPPPPSGPPAPQQYIGDMGIPQNPGHISPPPPPPLGSIGEGQSPQHQFSQYNPPLPNQPYSLPPSSLPPVSAQLQYHNAPPPPPPSSGSYW